MFCTQCGQKNPEDAKFCLSCGHSLIASTQARLDLPVKRPGIVSVLAVLQFVSGSFMALLAFALVASLFVESTNTAPLWIAGIVFAAVAALQVACGIGLWKLKSYGRTIQLVLAWIGLIGFPVGTILSIMILVYLYKPGIRILFAGTPPAQWTDEEAARVAATLSQGTLGVALGAAILVVVLIAVIGIVAAIAVPGLLRARIAGNEASAIGSMRTINRAQAQYYQKCDGYAPTLSELGSNSVLLQDNVIGAVTALRNGYNIAIEPAADALLRRDPPPGCVGTITAFFARADPVSAGTGARHFATDARGTVFQSARAISNPIGASAVPLP